MQLTKQQVNTIIQNAPQGTDKNSILDGLIKRGYELEGVDTAQARQLIASKESAVVPDIKPTLRERFNEAAQDVGQVFTDTARTSQKRADNIAALELKEQSGKSGGVETALKQTGQALGAGADAIGNVSKGGIKVLASQKREDKLKELVGQFGAEVAKRPEVQKIASWYSNLDEKQKEAVDAAGGAASLVSEFTGVGAAGKGVKVAGEAAEQGIKQAGKVTSEAVDSVADSIKQVKSAMSPKVVTDIVRDVAKSSSPKELAARQFTKAFKLSPSDVTTIEGMTGGKNVANWANANGLIKDTADETLDALAKFKRDNYDAVRDAVLLVDDKYGFKDIPAMERIIDDLIADTNGLQSNRFKEVNSQLKQIVDKFNKGEGDLSDVQTVKAMFDDLKSVYTRSNDVKAGTKFLDMDDSISDLRRFIESRVKESNPDINVAELNNNVRIASEFLDSAVKRSGKFDTAAITSLGDYFIFGLGQQVAPGLGLASVLGKKFIGSSPVRMRLARAFAGAEGIEGTNINEIKKKLMDALAAEADIKAPL